MAETFKLPVSSYEELIKVIQAYSSVKEGTLLSLDDLSQSTGMARTVVSSNNGFLVQIGLITEGNKKTATEIGRSLGRAYTSRVDEEIVRLWKEVIGVVDFLNRMVSAVRIRNGMDRTSLLNHIIYSSGLKDNKQNRAGAGAMIEILKVAEILSETDGKLTVNDDHTVETSVKSTAVATEISVNEPQTIRQSINHSIDSGVTINININCSANDIDELGDKIKSLIEKLSK